MLWSAPGMIIGLTLASISFYCKYQCRRNFHFRGPPAPLQPPIFLPPFFIYELNPDTLPDMTRKTGGNLTDGVQYSKVWSALVLVSMIVFVASYATGLGNVPWQQGELFSLEGEPLTPFFFLTSHGVKCFSLRRPFLALLRQTVPRHF